MRRTPNVLLLAAACKAGVMNENFPLPFDVHIRSTRIVATVQSEQFELRPTAFDYCLTMSGFLILPTKWALPLLRRERYLKRSSHEPGTVRSRRTCR
jgi:hypothetical protein